MEIQRNLVIRLRKKENAPKSSRKPSYAEVTSKYQTVPKVMQTKCKN